MMNRIRILYICTTLVLAIFSYGFIDPHLTFSDHPMYTLIQNRLVALVYTQTIAAAIVYLFIIATLFAGYGMFVFAPRAEKVKAFPLWIAALLAVVLFSYPALSYDIYNYIATAKVAFLYKENPYVVMPIEIPNEPMLSYTRAANKVALYGPAWIILSSFPHVIGGGRIFWTILAFKAFVGAFYLAVTYVIYRKTRQWNQALFFALNPLVIIEIVSSGHNDIAMMALGISGLLLWNRKRAFHKAAGLVLFISSVFIKGATVVLAPLFFFPAWTWEKKMFTATCLLFAVFLLSPLREEMYPWYAVWWISCLAFVPIRKNSFIHGLAYWLSLGLMLRYLPWIATREYGGITPTLRIMVTVVPVVIFLIYRFRKKAKQFITSFKKNL